MNRAAIARWYQLTPAQKAEVHGRYGLDSHKPTWQASRVFHVSRSGHVIKCYLDLPEIDRKSAAAGKDD